MKQYNLLIFVVVTTLSYGMTLGQGTNVTEEWQSQSLPRLCSMNLNETTFTCRYVDYTQNVLLRSLLAIILAGVVFIALTIGLCCCCWKTSLQDQIKLKDAKYSPKCNAVVKILLMLIPLVAFLVGCLLILTAHYNLNPTFKGCSNELNFQYNNVGNIFQKLNGSLPEGYVDPSVYNTMKGGVNELRKNINTFTQALDGFDIGRTVIVWFSCALAVLTGILSCVYVHLDRKSSIFEWYCAFAIFLTLGSCLAIMILQCVRVVGTDTCNELYYQEGAIQLLQADLKTSLEQVVLQIESSINSETQNICTNANDMCYRGPTNCCNQMCAPCNSATALSFQNKTISDNNQMVVVINCAAGMCTDQGLKNYASQIVKSSQIITKLNSFEEEALSLLNPFSDYNFILRLRSLFCYNSYPINLIWLGCAFFLLACVISSVLCLLLRGTKEHYTS